jgi:SAM-dependent methyltransferase
MSAPGQADQSAKQAYEVYAPAYDAFNRAYMYERWTGRLLAKAEEKGLEGDRLLDVACGTGLSFVAMLDRGWRVTGCDISPAMLELARAKVGESVQLHVADMRELPALGRFDLVWAVNDALNYLLSPEEFESTLAGMGRNLAPGGVILFDVNTLVTYRRFFSSECVVEEGGRRMVWQGLMTAEEVAPASINEARFEAQGDPDSVHVHRQRHFTTEEVLKAAEGAGLRPLGIAGELDGALDDELREDHHTKAVYLLGTP